MYDCMSDTSSESKEADLVTLAATLVPLEAWTRQRGLDEFAELLGPVVELLDRQLTGR